MPGYLADASGQQERDRFLTLLLICVPCRVRVFFFFFWKKGCFSFASLSLFRPSTCLALIVFFLVLSLSWYSEERKRKEKQMTAISSFGGELTGVEVFSWREMHAVNIQSRIGNDTLISSTIGGDGDCASTKVTSSRIS